MAILNRINPSSKTNNDTGFGTTADNYGGRFINRDGTYNLKKIGIPFRNRFSLFHTMLNMSLWKFITVIVLFFLSTNLVYALIYFALGADGFQGIIAVTKWQQFKELYFFSTETLRRLVTEG